jgi:hypothetical protein
MVTAYLAQMGCSVFLAVTVSLLCDTCHGILDAYLSRKMEHLAQKIMRKDRPNDSSYENLVHRGQYMGIASSPERSKQNHLTERRYHDRVMQ